MNDESLESDVNLVIMLNAFHKINVISYVHIKFGFGNPLLMH